MTLSIIPSRVWSVVCEDSSFMFSVISFSSDAPQSHSFNLVFAFRVHFVLSLLLTSFRIMTYNTPCLPRVRSKSHSKGCRSTLRLKIYDAESKDKQVYMVRAPLFSYKLREITHQNFPSLVLGHVLSPVRFLPRHSLFADCKLYIRTRLLASAFSNFWKTFLPVPLSDDIV